MKILIVSNRYPVDREDTASPFVADFCRALEHLGHRPHVVTPFYPPERPERDPWVSRFRWVDSDRVLGQIPLRTASGLMTAYRAYRAGQRAVLDITTAFRPDYILALWALPSGLWAMKAARTHGLPYGVWCLGSDIQLWGRRLIFKPLVRRVLRRANHLYADGFALAEETGELARRHCAFLPSLRELSTAPAAGDRPPYDGKPYYLYFGRLARDKGVTDVLAAAELLRGKDVPTIVFAGSPEPDLDVEAEIRRRCLKAICRAEGTLKPAQIVHYLRHARALLLPSRRDSIPLVLGEAMQCRTPIICSNLPDFRALMQRYPVGVIASHWSPETWAETLRSFAPDPAWQEDMARFCHDFDPHRAAEQVIADIEGTAPRLAIPDDIPARTEVSHA